MGLFDGYFDPEQFGEGGGLLRRLLALQQGQGGYQPSADLDRASSAPPQPTPWPALLSYGEPSSSSPVATSNPTSQYQTSPPVLGDRSAVLATVHPDIGKALIAQALANQQPDNNANVVSAGYSLGRLRAPPAVPVPLPQIPVPAIPEWWKAAGTMLQLYPGIVSGLDGAPATSPGAVILNSRGADRPPAGSRPIKETDWSGDHKEIKGAIDAKATDHVSISPKPEEEVWAQNPDGSWTNHGPASTFTGSGKPNGRRGKDRNR